MTTSNQQPRPSILAVIDIKDCGPCDPEPSGVCPHCGAYGRWIYTCLMSDGTHKGMMKGCLHSFKRDACAVECERALSKQKEAIKGNGYVSKWDSQVINALDGFVAGTVSLLTLRAVCDGVRMQKKQWMRSKGYCR
jgi:hypothetical protein